ncbi:MAG TPA: isocitrate/isopropylmalate dehydrogenase family protein [Firmicutes bacterium]|nr:isocitrate/isopropylmalate dehydrogenase family protein [Bacillota bacterium]
MSHRVTLIPGDGIGPEVVLAARRVIEATGVSIEWEEAQAGAEVLARRGTPLPDEVIESIRRTGVALKGPVTTPVGTGFRSVNVGLRIALDLYANVRPIRTLPSVPTRYPHVDIVIFREATEDVYAGKERWVDEDTAETIKIITRRGSERIARAAMEFARREGRHRVTCGHKANIMKFSDGLFLDCARAVARDYPEIQFDDWIIDALCMQLVMAPESFDVLLLPNLYGDIVSDLASGLVGGLGLAPGANIGDGIAVFEPVHGSAPGIAGRGIANPIATILSGAMMLRHLGEAQGAAVVEAAVTKVLAEGRVLTPDLGGTATTGEMADAIISALASS